MAYLGLNIKKIRERWGLSQEEFGILINASRAMVMQYENRGSMPKNETVSKIAKVTALSKDELINAEIADDQIPEIRSEDQVKIDNYRLNPQAFTKGELSKTDVEKLKAFEEGVQARIEMERQMANQFQAKYLEQVELRMKDLEQDKRWLQNMLELNLGKATAMIEKVMKVQTAHDDVIMKSLDRLEKQPEGTLSERADTLELEIDQRLQNLSDSDKKLASSK